MTRYAGDHIIKAPCCNKNFLTPTYSSVNLTAYENWTDGRAFGSLFNGGSGLRLCTCGEVFLLKDAETIGFVPKNKPQAPVDWQRKSISWWHRLWGFPTTMEILRNFDIRSEEEIKKSQENLPPISKHVDDDELETLLEKTHKPEIELKLRRLYWQYLNDEYRSAPNASMTESQPIFKPSVIQIRNMQLLARLINDSDEVDIVELIEIYRELGDFAKAEELLPLIPNGYEDEATLQKNLLLKKDRAPAII